MNGDRLGRVSDKKTPLFQFVVERNPNKPEQRYSFLPLVIWVTAEVPITYERPAGCKCRTIFRGDRRSSEIWMKITGVSGNHICLCAGRLLE